jgi:hypothetical protein
MVPLPLPEVVTVHQVWSLDTIQEEFDVTVNEVLPAGGVTVWLGGATVSVGDEPAWETVTVTGVIPVMVTVIFATRDENEVFWV